MSYSNNDATRTQRVMDSALSENRANLTTGEKLVLIFMASAWCDRGFKPFLLSKTEISKGLEISVETVKRAKRKLLSAGYISLEGGGLGRGNVTLYRLNENKLRENER